jgi:peptide/nickel transport system substrate-binding protein
MKTQIKLFLISCLLLVCILAGVHGVMAASDGPIDIRMAIRMQIASMDPINSNATWEYVTLNNIYSTLIVPDPDPRKALRPWIAKSWKVSDDAKTYTFYLREGVKFHDGTELTAEDVQFSMDRQQTLGGTTSTYFKTVKPGSTKVIDKYTVEFHLEKPDPSFLQSQFIFKILNKKLVMKNIQPGRYGDKGDYGAKWIDTNDAGSGPYRIVQRIHGDRLVLEKFQDYSFRKWQPNSIDRVTFLTIPETTTISTKMKKGEVDLVDFSVPPEIIRDFQKTEGVKVYIDPSDTPWYITLNNKRPPLDDVNVRKAMAYAFDYDTVITKILIGGIPSQGPVPNNVIGHNNNILVYKRDMNKAKEYIAKSKYSKEQLAKYELEFASSAGNVMFLNIALLAATNFKDLGLNVKVREVRWADISAHQVKPETAFPLTIFYQGAVVPHPQQFLVYYTPEGWGTPFAPGGMYYENPKVTELIQKAKNSAKAIDQNKYYEQAQEYIVEDVPSLFLNNDVLAQVMWDYIKGYEMPAGAAYYQLIFDKFTVDTENPFYKKNHPK